MKIEFFGKAVLVWLFFGGLLALGGGMVLNALPGWQGRILKDLLDLRGGESLDLITVLFGMQAGTLIPFLARKGMPKAWAVAGAGLAGGALAITGHWYAGLQYPGHYVAGILGPLLVLPWLLRRLVWPRRSPGALAFGVSAIATIILQVLFHLVLIVPFAGEFRHSVNEAKAAIERTASREDLEAIAQSGALGLQRVYGEVSEAEMQGLDANVKDALSGSLKALLRDDPDALVVQDFRGADGLNRIDATLLVFDDRPLRGQDVEASLWIIPVETYKEPRAIGLRAYLALSGASVMTWITAAFVVLVGHRRRRG